MCSPCVSLTFLIFKLPSTAQRPSSILYFSSLETFLCPLPVYLPTYQPSLLWALRLAISQTTQRGAGPSAMPPTSPSGCLLSQKGNQALPIRAHLLSTSPCHPHLSASPMPSFLLENLGEPTQAAPAANDPLSLKMPSLLSATPTHAPFCHIRLC